MGEQRGLAPLLTVDLAPVTVELNLRESGARFPCKWSSVLEIYNGEMLSSDCEEKLEAAGFKKSTIKKAKKKAGVISRKRGFLWYWSLPMGDIPRE